MGQPGVPGDQPTAAATTHVVRIVVIVQLAGSVKSKLARRV